MPIDLMGQVGPYCVHGRDTPPPHPLSTMTYSPRRLTRQEIAADRAAVDAMIARRLRLLAVDQEREEIRAGRLADRGLIGFN